MRALHNKTRDALAGPGPQVTCKQHARQQKAETTARQQAEVAAQQALATMAAKAERAVAAAEARWEQQRRGGEPTDEGQPSDAPMAGAREGGGAETRPSPQTKGEDSGEDAGSSEFEPPAASKSAAAAPGRVRPGSDEFKANVKRIRKELKIGDDLGLVDAVNAANAKLGLESSGSVQEQVAAALAMLS